MQNSVSPFFPNIAHSLMMQKQAKEPKQPLQQKMEKMLKTLGSENEQNQKIISEYQQQFNKKNVNNIASCLYKLDLQSKKDIIDKQASNAAQHTEV